jgi:transposase
MQSAASSGSSTLTEVSAEELAVLVRSQAQTIAELKHRLAWFERQLFGQKSERLKLLEDPRQMVLGEVLVGAAGPAPAGQTVAAHVRRPARRNVAADVGEAESVPFFDASRVPVEVIEVALPEIEGLAPDQYEVIGTKRSYRLAQRPGSYVVIEYVRKVIKRKDIDPESGTAAIVCAPAPAGVLEGSRADVSFLAGLLLDKFRYHLPLYRQHQRLIDAGISVSRPWLTQLTQSAIALLAPIYEAQLASIRMSRVIAMDETPIKAGRTGHGKMKTAYFWPLYGGHDEVCFPYRPNRNHEHVASLLGGRPAPGTVLHTDGYAAYESYAKAAKITHAQCWAHARRELFEATEAEPQRARLALEHIAGIYAVEERIRQHGLLGDPKREQRVLEAKPRVEAFFTFIDEQFAELGLMPATPFTKALGYVRDRKQELSVFLTDPDVALDTNHLERALRVVPMGRKAWMFCWTELGARDVGIVQSLIVTCRLHGVDVYSYLIDVLQRVAQHPASRVEELTPRHWKARFSQNPLPSPLHAVTS